MTNVILTNRITGEVVNGGFWDNANDPASPDYKIRFDRARGGYNLFYKQDWSILPVSTLPTVPGSVIVLNNPAYDGEYPPLLRLQSDGRWYDVVAGRYRTESDVVASGWSELVVKEVSE